MEIVMENSDLLRCASCGEKYGEGDRFCINCGASLPSKRKVRFKVRYVLLGVIGLIAAGGFLFLSAGISKSELVAKVNGEGITRKEFLQRLDQSKRFYESRYGLGLFEGQDGKENLNRLRSNILEEMLIEKILLKKAENAGYTTAPEAEIEKQLEAIKKQYRLSDTDLDKMGRNIENLKAELRKEWVISQFVEKAVLKGDQTNGQQVFGQWLAKAKADAKIETYEKFEPVTTARASCCSSGCGGGRAQPLDPKIEQEAKSKGLEYYEKKTQKKGASARVTDFGCHIQVDIIDNGKVIVSLTYRNGEVEEI